MRRAASGRDLHGEELAAAVTPAPPADDADVPGFVAELGLPGLCDIHVHFHPDRLQRKIWQYFDAAGENYGMPWPITYRTGEAERVQTLRDLGVRTIPALTYAHRPGMAEALNHWCADFAARVPDALHCGTFYPEQGAAEYVLAAIDGGAELFKTHLQVGHFAATDPLLDDVWQILAERAVPTVIHCGSAPLPGEHTGPQGVTAVLEAHPDLTVVIAHMGMPEYLEFAALAQSVPGVYLDTTMAFTDFSNRIAPPPEGYLDTLAQLSDKVLLGSDFPSIPYPYAHQIQALADLGLGEEWLRQVLWSNGRRLLGLSQTGEPQPDEDLPENGTAR